VEKLYLSANKRELLGKQVKTLRSKGVLPGNIYGKGLESVAVSLPEKEFRVISRSAGETGVVYLKIEGEDKDRPVLIHSISKHPITRALIHADLYQVNLREKTTANVPIIMVGENELEKNGEALIMQVLNEIEVEALPTDIPHEFQIDITSLLEIGQSIKVSDLNYDREKVEIKMDTEENVLIVQEAQMPEESEEDVTAESNEGVLPEVIGEKAEENGEESVEKSES
jgi:large subunit ribosomal protein L25